MTPWSHDYRLLPALEVAIVWAQTQTQPSTPGQALDILLQYGPLGLVIVLALTGQLYFKPTVKILEEDKKKYQELNERLIQTYETQALPALHEAIDAIKRTSTVLEGQKAAIEGQTGTLSRLEQAVTQLQNLILMSRGGTSGSSPGREGGGG